MKKTLRTAKERYRNRNT